MTLFNIIYVLISQLPWFYQRPCYLSIFPFMSTLRVIWILPINSKWRQVTSRHYIVSIKLCPEVGRNGEYLIVHNFAGRRMRGFIVTERDLGAPTLPPPPAPHRGRREQNNKPGLNTTAVKRLNRYFCFLLLGFHLPVREKWTKMYKSVSQHNYLFPFFSKFWAFFAENASR